ncbi:MAG: proton-conducting transporter membrane subunit [Desulfocapsaceae bacterium]|nr:proton-conducting transporter membrane subunit [Desulfocapsaceae bacterium]
MQTTDPIRLVLFAWPWEVLPVVELSIDRLAAVMMVVISGIGTLLFRYSSRYLQGDPQLPLYQILLTACISSLLFMVSSADLVTLFISWQLLSWLLSLLSHNYAHVPTSQAAFRTFIMLRLGDIAFLSGIVLAYHLFGTVKFAPLFERAMADPMHLTLLGGIEISGATAVAMLIFIGAMSKSAQFPLHMWLPDSLYAPTPIHALLHAGIINAGGFLLNRMAPLYALSTPTLHVVFVIGLLTAILGTSMMLVQNDIKKTLGYSTIGQMGYMIMECGLGAFSLAVFHLIAHGLFKASIFLNCGDVIHQARHDPARPPHAVKEEKEQEAKGWVTALIISLVLPFLLVTGAHYFLDIAILEFHGLLIFLLFSWVTASHATLTIFHANIEHSVTLHGYVLVVVGLVSAAYLFAAETFTHFLYPDPAVVSAYFQAGALPTGVFILIIALFIISISGGWFFVYTQRTRQGGLLPGKLLIHLYLFFANRLYFDGLALRVNNAIARAGKAIDRSQFANYALAVIALLVAVLSMLPDLSGAFLISIMGLFVVGLLLPLFPFHVLYLKVLTQAPRKFTVALSILLPAFGLLVTAVLIPKLPEQARSALGALAVIGAVWGSIKAMTQIRVPLLLAYAGLALYSVFWWHVAQAGMLTPHSILYITAVTLALGGLTYGWDRIRVRYGDLDLNQIGGLFRPMPRFALCMSLLIMAVVGLPPFALFFSYLVMLFSPSTTMSTGLIAVIAAWFAASWYMFAMMKRLLFGQHRTDLRYEDLGPTEIGAFTVVIVLLILLSGVSLEWIETGGTILAQIQGGM